MAGPTHNTDWQAINHFQFSAFWMEEWVFHLSHGVLTFLVSLEICGHKDLHALLPTHTHTHSIILGFTFVSVTMCM